MPCEEGGINNNVQEQFPHISVNTISITRHIKISICSLVKMYIECEGDLFIGCIGSPKNKYRVRMLLGVERDISQEETCG